MSVKTMDVFRCDLCKTTDTNPEGSWEVPNEWLTVRIGVSANLSGADDLHICPSCKYEDLISLWEKI
jgi:hypothetical protein